MASSSSINSRYGVFNKRKFISHEAQKIFNKILRKKKLIKERGFINHSGLKTTSIEETIGMRRWEVLCYTSSAVVVPVVKEFYANLHGINQGRVFVRGRWVNFTPTSVNELFMIEDVPVCHYANFQPTRRNLNEVYRFLTDEPEDWETRDNRYVSIPITALNPVSRHWHLFICAKLLPTIEIDKVGRESAILNYCIQSETPVDIGSIIVKSVLGLIVHGSPHGLGHPSTIFALCSQSQVSYENWENILLPWKPLDPTLVFGFPVIENDKDISERKQESQNSTTNQTPKPIPNSEILQRIKKLEKEMKNISSSISNMSDFFDHIDWRLKQNFDHTGFIEDSLICLLKKRKIISEETNEEYPIRPFYSLFAHTQDLGNIRESESTDSDE